MCNECHMEIDSYSIPVFLDEEGRLHCLDGPAHIYRNGTVLYYRHGKMHRDGGEPAVICADGHIEYWVNGKFVRHVHV